MKEQIDIIDIGMKFQMSLDAFLEESHVGYTKNEQSYQQALLKLEESKRVRSWQKKQQIAYEALDICEDCIEAYMMLGTYEEDHAVRIQRYKEGMELATMNLGKDFFLRKVDDFYSIEQAKPLFHIKFTYACALYEAGCMRKAQQQFQEILNLNPSDAFCAHHYLYALSLYFEEYESCKELLQKYDQHSAMDCYVRFLLSLKTENYAAAKTAIPYLQAANCHFYNILTYRSMNTLSQSQSMTPKSEEEAAYIYRILNKVIHVMEYLPMFLVKSE